MQSYMAEYLSATRVERRILNTTDSQVYEELEIKLKETLTVTIQDNLPVRPDQLFAYLQALNLKHQCFGIQRKNITNHIHQSEITLKIDVNLEEFKKIFLSQDPPQCDGKRLSIVESRWMKDRTIKEVTKVLLFEAPSSYLTSTSTM